MGKTLSLDEMSGFVAFQIIQGGSDVYIKRDGDTFSFSNEKEESSFGVISYKNRSYAMALLKDDLFSFDERVLFDVYTEAARRIGGFNRLQK